MVSQSGADGPPPPRYVNAYFDKDRIAFVERDGDDVRIRRVRAENSCFIHDGDMSRELYRMLRDTPLVRAIKRDTDTWWRVVWADQHEARNCAGGLHKKGVMTYEAGINPIRRHCADKRAVIQRPRRVYLDIETDSRVPFSRKEDMRVLCWALVDESGGGSVGVLEEFTDAGERRLLEQLWRQLEKYDQVISWNGDRFDFPVVKARTKRVRLDVNTKRWLWLDHLELFRRMNMMAADSGDEKQSFALQAIAMAVLGEGKDPFDASKTYEAWARGNKCRARRPCNACRRCMVTYCIKDTRLMPAIEDKTGYVELLQTLCEVTGTFPDTRGVAPGAQCENLLLRLALERDYHFPSRLRMGSSGKYKGAFVMDPTEGGIVKDVHVADFSALYPSIILTWNMSLETTVEEEVEGRTATAPLTNVVFDQDTEGILPVAVARMVELRGAWKKRKAAAAPGTPEAKEADRRSTAYKIAANSLYGVVGSPTSRLFNRAVAESVSQGGVWLIKETIRAAEKRGMRAIYGDTDSLFVAGCTRTEFEAFVAWCNAELYPRILRERGCKKNLIELDYEKQFERIVWTSAKRYVGCYAHYKGSEATADSKPEVKGLEYNRGDSAKLARELQLEVINKLVGFKTEISEEPRDFERIVARHQRRALTDELAVDEVVKSQRLGKPINAYVRSMKDDGTEARQLPHVEIAKVLAERGRDVAEGAKIVYFCVDGGCKPKKYLPAEDWEGQVDRFDLWDSLVWPPTKRVLEAAFPGHDWARWGRTRPLGGRERAVIQRETQAAGLGPPRLAKRAPRVSELQGSLPWGVVPDRAAYKDVD